MFNGMITSGEIINCKNAKRVTYDRYGLWVGEKLDVHLDQKIGENETNTFFYHKQNLIYNNGALNCVSSNNQKWMSFNN